MGSAASKARTVGLIVLTIASLTAGFLAATVETSPPLVPASQLEQGEAWRVTLETGEAAHVGLAGDEGHARVTIYDPDDQLHREISLEGDQTVAFGGQTGGAWILVVTGERDGTLTVEVTEPSAGDGIEVDRARLMTSQRTLVENRNGSVDVQTSLPIDRRPAVAFFEVEGLAEELEAEIVSPTGRVVELSVASLNGTRTLEAGPGTQTVSPAHLVPGIYRVSVTADRFEGTLDLVHRSYVRTADPWPALNASLPSLQDRGVPVAAMTEGQAFRIDAQEADTLRFAAARDTVMNAYVYGPDHEIVAVARLGQQSAYAFDFSEEQDRAPIETTQIGIDGSETYVVYIEDLYGHGDRVYALLPELRTAEPAAQLEIQRTRVHLASGTVATDEDHTVEAKLTGGLVGIELRLEDTASTDHRIRVSGPNGLVFLHQESTTVAGSSQERYRQVNPTHFSDGRFEIVAEERYTVDGDAWITLQHYVPPTLTQASS